MNAYKLSMLYHQTWDGSKYKKLGYRKSIMSFSHCKFENDIELNKIKLRMWKNPNLKDDIEVKMLRLIYCRKTKSLLVILSSVLRIGKRSAMKRFPKDLIRKLDYFI